MRSSTSLSEIVARHLQYIEASDEHYCSSSENEKNGQQHCNHLRLCSSYRQLDNHTVKLSQRPLHQLMTNLSHKTSDTIADVSLLNKSIDCSNGNNINNIRQRSLNIYGSQNENKDISCDNELVEDQNQQRFTNFDHSRTSSVSTSLNNGENHYVVDLSHSCLDSIEAIGALPSTTRILSLAYNQFENSSCKTQDLPYSSEESLKWIEFLSNLPNLEVLDLSYNKLQVLPFNDSRCLRNVKALNLSHNRISSLSIFKNIQLPQLRTLILSDNASLMQSVNDHEIQGLFNQFANLRQVWVRCEPPQEEHIISNNFNGCTVDNLPLTDRDIRSPQISRLSALSRIEGRLIQILPRKVKSCGQQSDLFQADLENILLENSKLKDLDASQNSIIEKYKHQIQCTNEESYQLQLDLKAEKRVNVQLESRLNAMEQVQEQTSMKLVAWQEKSTTAVSEISNLREQNIHLNMKLKMNQQNGESEIKMLRKEMDEIEYEIERLLNEKISFEKSQQELVKKLECHNQQLDEELHSMEAKSVEDIQAIQKKLRQEQHKYHQSTTDNKSICAKLERLQKREGEQSTAIALLSTQVETLQAQLKVAESSRCQINENNRLAEQRCGQLEAELADCQEHISELSLHWVAKSEFESKSTACEELEAKSSAQKERIIKLVERNETMRLEIEQLKSSVLAAEKLATEKDLTLQIQNQQMADTTTLLESTKGKLSSAQRGLEDAEKKTLRLENDLKIIVKEKNKLEEEIERLRQQCSVDAITNEKKLRMKLEQKIDTMEKEKNKRDEAFLYLQDAIDELQKDMETQQTIEIKRMKEIEESHNSTKSKLETSENILLERTNECHQLGTAMRELQELLAKRDQEIEVLMKEIEELEIREKEKFKKFEDFLKTINE